jgi:two-component system repressor protein LuxO
MPEASAPDASAIARLLLIDRDGAISDSLEAPLRSRMVATPVVIEARAGRQALELMRAGEFDVVLADLASIGDLAERTEDAVARLARQAAEALILVFSDGASVSATVAAMRAGAHECMTKPVSGDAVALRIGALALRLGRPRAMGVATTEMIGTAPANGVPATAAVEFPAVLPLWQQEQRIIEDAIRLFAGNIAAAAAALELSPSTIYRKRQAWAEMDARRGVA